MAKASGTETWQAARSCPEKGGWQRPGGQQRASWSLVYEMQVTKTISGKKAEEPAVQQQAQAKAHYPYQVADAHQKASQC